MTVILPYIILLLLWRFRRIPEVSSLQTVAGRAPTPFSRDQLANWLLATAAALALLTLQAPSLTLTRRSSRPAITNLAVILDLSGSMDASDWPDGTTPPDTLSPEDLPPSRLTVAKGQLRQFLQDCPDTRAALIGFAGNTVLVAPLADSPAVLLERLDTLQTGQFTDGTATGQAILAAVRALDYAPDDGPKAIVLFSDGVDHSSSLQSSPENAAEAACAKGITLLAVGIGGEQALHPVHSDSGTRWSPVGEPLDMARLTRLARMTGGQAFHAKDGRQLSQAVSSIRSRLTSNSTVYPVRQTVFLAPWLLSAALLLCGAAVLAERRARP